MGEYLTAQGKNEKVRLVEISDLAAKSLDAAFHQMWLVASETMATKPLHHISINPSKDERLTDDQVLKIVKRCEEKYRYNAADHQRVIVEHIKDGRQHFHVVWNRVSTKTGRPVWPGEHWKKSKQAAREMEAELGLKRPVPKRAKCAKHDASTKKRGQLTGGRYLPLKRPRTKKATFQIAAKQMTRPVRVKTKVKKTPLPALLSFGGAQDFDLVKWAWENKRQDILFTLGIILPPDYFNL